MEYMTTKQAADQWLISDRRVLQYCNDGRIKGAVKMGNTWLVPKKAEKPCDLRKRRKTVGSEVETAHEHQ